MPEAVCAARYAAPLARMGRLERIVLGVAGTLIVGVGELAVKPRALVAKVGTV